MHRWSSIAFQIALQSKYISRNFLRHLNYFRQKNHQRAFLWLDFSTCSKLAANDTQCRHNDMPVRTAGDTHLLKSSAETLSNSGSRTSGWMIISFEVTVKSLLGTTIDYTTQWMKALLNLIIVFSKSSCILYRTPREQIKQLRPVRDARRYEHSKIRSENVST